MCCACYSCCQPPSPPCASCCSWGTANNCCNSCPKKCPKPAKEPLVCPDDYKWFERCTKKTCMVCQENETASDCKCTCRRNLDIIEALSYLFNCTNYHIVSILFKLAYQQSQPMQRFPRERSWEVMLNVKAPYSEMHDLEIYDSMYDRCGYPIEPLDPNNILKVVRMMFLTGVLSLDQQQYLMRMLQRLNDHAAYRVNLLRLLKTLENVDLKDLVCSIIEQNKHCANFYNARLCAELCALYRKVTTTDKNEIVRRRRKKRVQKKPSKTLPTPKKKKPLQQQIYCVRRPVDPVDLAATSRRSSATEAELGSRVGSMISTGRHRRSTRQSMRHNMHGQPADGEEATATAARRRRSSRLSGAQMKPTKLELNVGPRGSGAKRRSS